MKILLVDDDADMLEEVGATLRLLGHTTIAAGDAAAACVALENGGAFDLVLTDLQMRAGTGLDVLRTCTRKASPQPVMLVMTGNACGAEMDHAVALGVQGFLSKPFTRHQLSDAMSLAMCTSRSSFSGEAALR